MGETGFPGLFLWIALLYIVMKSLWQLNSEPKDLVTSTYARGLFVAMVGYVFSSLFVTLEYLTYYLLMAICLSLPRIVGRPLTFTMRDARNVFVIMEAHWYAAQRYVDIAPHFSTKYPTRDHLLSFLK